MDLIQNRIQQKLGIDCSIIIFLLGVNSQTHIYDEPMVSSKPLGKAFSRLIVKQSFSTENAHTQEMMIRICFILYAIRAEDNQGVLT